MSADRKWDVFERGFGAEVIPHADIREHRGGVNCACKPFWDSPTVLVHNAFDEREKSEPDYVGPQRGRGGN